MVAQVITAELAERLKPRPVVHCVELGAKSAKLQSSGTLMCTITLHSQMDPNAW